MRKQVLAVLLLLVVMISGCAEVSTAPTEKREPVTETKAADENRTDSVFPSESKQAAAPAESEAPEETESPESTEAHEAAASQPTAQETQKAPEPAAEAHAMESQPPAPTASEDTKAPVSAEETPPAPTEKPQETQPPTEAPQPTAAPEEIKQKTAYDYAFDIEAIKADCIGIGQGMGLTLDSSLTPDNAAWWNPVTASQSNQGEALKQSLVSYITFHTAENLGAYGMDEITSFNICCEARGNGEYLIYFLFA
ncbi:hypothetical protein LI221_03380 [Faecalimonas umbilicata]|nr:hypothetical protein [Faecalimonas umbilicata]